MLYACNVTHHGGLVLAERRYYVIFPWEGWVRQNYREIAALREKSSMLKFRLHMHETCLPYAY